MAKSPNLYAYSSIDLVAATPRPYVLHCQKAGLARHDAFKVAISGGSLPATLSKALLSDPQPSDPDTLDFTKWEIFFADERAVPYEHDDSNYGLLKKDLLDHIPES